MELKRLTYLLLFFIFFQLVSCKQDDSAIQIEQTEAHVKSNQTVVIIKADDLRNLTPNWRLFISNSIENNVPVSIGIISRGMTDVNTIDVVKKMSKLTNSNGDLRLEFWNHGYDHSKDKKRYEFNGNNLAHQVNDIKLSQNFFKNTLGLTCNSFGVPYNQSSKETYEALKSFPEIKIWMCYQKQEKQLHSDWLNPNLSNISSTQEHIILDVKCLSVHDVPFESVKRYLGLNPDIPYLMIQIHPNVWGVKEFVDYQNMIDYLKEKNVIFMTPLQYYKYTTSFNYN